VQQWHQPSEWRESHYHPRAVVVDTWYLFIRKHADTSTVDIADSTVD
jgi:hypothetical protein